MFANGCQGVCKLGLITQSIEAVETYQPPPLRRVTIGTRRQRRRIVTGAAQLIVCLG